MPASTSTRKRKPRKDRVPEEVKVKAEDVANALSVKPDEAPKDATESGEKKVADSGEKVDEQPLKLPKHLLDRMAAAQKAFEDIQDEVKKFKEHPDFRPGNMLGTLYGLKGNPNILGGRSLNFIDPDHVWPDIHIHWSNKRMVDWHRGQGYEPFDHDRFMEMVTARGGAYSYGRNAENHVVVGDLVLMRTSRDHYEAREQAKREKTRMREKRAKNTLYQKGTELGVEVYEGDAGPKLNKIIDLLVNEFGEEDVRRIFQNH